jgi:hypothetical protein
MRSFTRQTISGVVSGSALVLSVLLAPGVANAQQLPRASDGQTFESQSPDAQALFLSMYGPGCAAQEWVWQHDLAIGALEDAYRARAATDGQTLKDQNTRTQLMFTAVWGPMAVAQWVAEHNAVVARRVLLSNVGQVPCPAARVVQSFAINPAHIDAAVEEAEGAELDEAHEEFREFRALWMVARNGIRQRAPALADEIQAAVDQATAIIANPAVPNPPQSQYLPALENLLRLVQTANAQLAGSAAAGPTAAPGPDAAPPPVAALQIRARAVGEAVEAAEANNINDARDEFAEFQRDWAAVKDEVVRRAPSVAARVDAAIAQTSPALGTGTPAPPQAQYLAALEALLQVVEAANAELAR